MKTVSRISAWALASVLLLWAQAALAEVYKCTGADGKTSYSEAPCAGAGAKEVQVNITPAAPADAASSRGTDWKAQNAAANGRGMAAMAPTQRSGYPTFLPGMLGKSAKGGNTTKTAQQLVAECEANHGSRCNSAQEINQRRLEQRTLTPEEEKTRNEAVAARRWREREEQEARERRLDQR